MTGVQETKRGASQGTYRFRQISFSLSHVLSRTRRNLEQVLGVCADVEEAYTEATVQNSKPLRDVAKMEAKNVREMYLIAYGTSLKQSSRFLVKNIEGSLFFRTL